MKKINLRNVACEICEKIEGWLDEKDITIPNEERDEYTDDEEEKEELARLFGSDYYDLEDFVVESIENFVTQKCTNEVPKIINELTNLLDSHNISYAIEDMKELEKDIKLSFIRLYEEIQKSKDEEIEFETESCTGCGL